MNMKKLKKDIIEYDLYEVVDDIPYSDCFLTILNEDDKIIIIVRDNQGSASWAMNKDEFLNINTNEELEQLINSVLYYNYVEYEGE